MHDHDIYAQQLGVCMIMICMQFTMKQINRMMWMTLIACMQLHAHP
jgi:hypothetical protein